MADQAERTDFDSATEDLACDFVKEEVGRFDWRNNWLTLRTAGTARQKLVDWLQAIKASHDPESIMAFLDNMASSRGGKWL